MPLVWLPFTWGACMSWYETTQEDKLLGKSSHGLETACCTGMIVAYLRMKFNLLWYVMLVCLLSE